MDSSRRWLSEVPPRFRQKEGGTIPCVDILKIILMDILKYCPGFWAFLNNRCNDLIGLGKVVVKVNMLELLSVISSRRQQLYPVLRPSCGTPFFFDLVGCGGRGTERLKGKNKGKL